MGAMMENNTLIVSTESLPDRSERDEAVKSLEAKCQKIVNLAHDLQAAQSTVFRLESDLRTLLIDGAKADDALLAYGEAQRRFGALEADLYNLKDQIEEELKIANRDKRFGIYVSHTAEGLPIRVSKSLKKPLWG